MRLVLAHCKSVLLEVQCDSVGWGRKLNSGACLMLFFSKCCSLGTLRELGPRLRLLHSEDNEQIDRIPLGPSLTVISWWLSLHVVILREESMLCDRRRKLCDLLLFLATPAGWMGLITFDASMATVEATVFRAFILRFTCQDLLGLLARRIGLLRIFIIPNMIGANVRSE